MEEIKIKTFSPSESQKEKLFEVLDELIEIDEKFDQLKTEKQKNTFKKYILEGILKKIKEFKKSKTSAKIFDDFINDFIDEKNGLIIQEKNKQFKCKPRKIIKKILPITKKTSLTKIKEEEIEKEDDQREDKKIKNFLIKRTFVKIKKNDQKNIPLLQKEVKTNPLQDKNIPKITLLPINNQNYQRPGRTLIKQQPLQPLKNYNIKILLIFIKLYF